MVSLLFLFSTQFNKCISTFKYKMHTHLNYSLKELENYCFRRSLNICPLLKTTIFFLHLQITMKQGWKTIIDPTSHLFLENPRKSKFNWCYRAEYSIFTLKMRSVKYYYVHSHIYTQSINKDSLFHVWYLDLWLMVTHK